MKTYAKVFVIIIIKQLLNSGFVLVSLVGQPSLAKLVLPRF